MDPVISKAAAARIWSAHNEIEIGKKLLADIEDALRMGGSETDATPRDPFGRRRAHTFGIPSGDSGHRMLNVSPKLSVYVIRAHLADMERELAEACVAARMELDGRGVERESSDG